MNLHNAHVMELRSVLYSAISDLSKDALGFRVRFDPIGKTIAELFADLDYYGDLAAEEAQRERDAQYRATVRFEAMIIDLIACGANDRATAVRWIREGEIEREQGWTMGDESIRYNFGLPWDYDLDAGDNQFFSRRTA